MPRRPSPTRRLRLQVAAVFAAAGAAAGAVGGGFLATRGWLDGRPFAPQSPPRPPGTADPERELGAKTVPGRPPRAAGHDAPPRDRATPGLPRSRKTLGLPPGSLFGEALPPAFAAAAASPPPRPPGERPWAEALIAGLDRRPGRRGGRTDTLLLLFLNQTGDGRPQAGLLSIPRDLYVEVPGHGPARVNAVLRIARARGEDPHALLRRVVEDTLAVRIGHVFAIDLTGFEQVVDAVGGVEVAVPCPIQDDFEDPRTATGRRLLDVPAGPAVAMDGATAAMYVRSRHGRSDFSRARRQQAVVHGLLRKAKDPTLWLRWPALLDALGVLVETTATRGEILRLAQRVIRVDPTDLRKRVLDGEVTVPHRTMDGRFVLLPEWEGIDQAVRGLFRADAPRDRPAGSPCAPASAALRR
jgi:LCP family protein required for cell wall assembly